jgi:hypothetical protein
MEKTLPYQDSNPRPLGFQKFQKFLWKNSFFVLAREVSKFDFF